MSDHFKFFKPEDFKLLTGVYIQSIKDISDVANRRLNIGGKIVVQQDYKHGMHNPWGDPRCWTEGQYEALLICPRPIKKEEPICVRENKHESFKSYGWDYCGICGKALTGGGE